MTSANASDTRDRFGGCLIAGAAGDAMGGPFEGQPERLLQTVLTYLPDSRVRDRIVELKSRPNNLTVAEVGKHYGSSG